MRLRPHSRAAAVHDRMSPVHKDLRTGAFQPLLYPNTCEEDAIIDLTEKVKKREIEIQNNRFFSKFSRRIYIAYQKEYL